MNGITHHLKLQDVDLWALSDAWAAARAPGVPGAQREHRVGRPAIGSLVELQAMGI